MSDSLPPEDPPTRCGICSKHGTLDETGICLRCRENLEIDKQTIRDEWAENGE